MKRLCTGFACSKAACGIHIPLQPTSFNTLAAVQYRKDTASLLLAWISLLRFLLRNIGPSLETLLHLHQHQPYTDIFRRVTMQTLLRTCVCECKRSEAIKTRSFTRDSIAISSAHLRITREAVTSCTVAPQQLQKHMRRAAAS